jgi:hypothetical protein
MSRPIVSGALLLLAVLLAACGANAAPTGAPSDAPTPTAPTVTAAPEPTPGTALDACELVTPAIVQAATGGDAVPPGTLQAGPTVLSPGRTICRYEGDFGRLIVDLVPEDGANLYDAARRAVKDASDVTLGGLGDGAFYTAANGRAFFWAGSVNVMLEAHFNATVEERPTLEGIGLAALAAI